MTAKDEALDKDMALISKFESYKHIKNQYEPIMSKKDAVFLKFQIEHTELDSNQNKTLIHRNASLPALKPLNFTHGKDINKSHLKQSLIETRKVKTDFGYLKRQNLERQSNALSVAINFHQNNFNLITSARNI
jgi:hypothetical protein